MLGLHRLGIAGWQWLFVLEGPPAVVRLLVVLVTLKMIPAKPDGLPDEKLRNGVLHQEQQQQANHGSDAWAAFLNWRIWLLSVVLSGSLSGLRHRSLMPLSFTVFQLPAIWVGIISVIPYAVTAIAMVLVGIHRPYRRAALAPRGFSFDSGGGAVAGGAASYCPRWRRSSGADGDIFHAGAILGDVNFTAGGTTPPRHCAG